MNIRKYSILGSFLKKKPEDKSNVYADLIPTIERDNTIPKIQVTELPNGVKVLTESVVFPTSVHIGALYKSGTRNETLKTSGILQCYKSLYLSLIDRNSLNQLQLIGTDIDLNITQETTYFSSYSLSQDTEKLLKVLFGSLSQRFHLNTQDYAQPSNYWDKNQLSSIDNVIKYLILRRALTAGLELPVHGLDSNKLTYADINKFIDTFHIPRNLYVCGAGIYNHDEFVDIVLPYLKNLNPGINSNWDKSTYKPFDLKINYNIPFYCYSVVYSTLGLSDKDYSAFEVLKYLVSDSDLDFINCRAKGIANKYKNFSKVYAVNMNYSDAGLFVVNFIGNTQKFENISDLLIEELKNLAKVNNEELESAKKRYKIDLITDFENTSKRIEFTVKNYALTGKIKESKDLILDVDAITPESIQSSVTNLLGTKPSLLILGKF
jgi:predicted Zn-dependent peptidase